MRMQILRATTLLLIGGVLAGCGARQGAGVRTDAREPGDLDDATAAAAADPSLEELYPSLGDEAVPPPSEIDAEKEDEEEFLAESEGDTPIHLDAEKLAASYDIPMEVTPVVEQYLTYFTTRGRKWYATWLSRSGRYLPMMKQIFRENGLPEDLTYLAMIESGFSTKAWSRARASGPWQFMRATGSRYGLNDDWWIDERRDPELATRAAAAHLRDLYEEFGDWYLAAAAYNAGSGKINRAIRMYGTRNYWELCAAGRYLKPETKHYVPKLIAAAIIAKHPEQFGFHGIEYLEPLEYENVTVTDATDLRVVAECADADFDSVRELNPSLKRFCTPPGQEAFEIRVPKGTAERFAQEYAKLDPARRVTFRHHAVRRGDTLSEIARRHGTDVSAIMRMNGLRSARSLRVGTNLVIPVPAGSDAAVNVATVNETPKPQRDTDRRKAVRVAAAAPTEPPAGREKVQITLTSGDTLWSLSQRYGVSVTEIKRWNAIRNHRSVQAGRRLTLYVDAKHRSAAAAPVQASAGAAVVTNASVVSYRVKKGDTIWDIARHHNVDPVVVLRDNNLSRRSTIKPGDVLEIRVGTN